MNYNSWFGFAYQPFAAAPRLEAYFPGQAAEVARQSMERCVERGAGPALLVGGPGTGKTMICHKMAEHFRCLTDVVMIHGAAIYSRRGLWQSILFELGMPYRAMEEVEMRLALVDHLIGRGANAPGMLLIVDEAHALIPSLFDEIRVLTNLVRDGKWLVNAIVAGNTTLEEVTASPRLSSFEQQIAARCYLRPFRREETFAYLKFQLERAGADVDTVFADQSVETVYRLCQGIPRLINQLCDHALMLAWVGGRRTIDRHGVEEAWRDLQQLPAANSPDHSLPNVAVSNVAVSNVVEFGALEESVARTTNSLPHADGATDGRQFSAQPTANHPTSLLDDVWSDSEYQLVPEDRPSDPANQLDELDRLDDWPGQPDQPGQGSDLPSHMGLRDPESQLDEIEHQLSAVATDHAHDDDLLDNSSVSISNSITDACEASSIGGVHFNPLADGEAACEANDRTAANLDTIGPCRGAGTCDPFHETFDDEEELVLDVFASGRNSLAVRQSQLPADNRQLMETLLDAHTVADAFDDALRQQRSHDTPPEQDETPDPFEVADTKVAEDQVVTITWDPGTVQAVSDDSSEPQQRYDRNDWYSRQQVGPQVGLRSRRSPIFGHLFTKVRQARD